MCDVKNIFNQAVFNIAHFILLVSLRLYAQNKSSSVHVFHNKIKCHCKLHRASSFVTLTASFLEGPAVELASIRPLANQLRTYGKQSKFGKGGPTIVISIRDDRCGIVIVLLREVQMMFISLKARSHSAVLTGRVRFDHSILIQII